MSLDAVFGLSMTISNLVPDKRTENEKVPTEPLRAEPNWKNKSDESWITMWFKTCADWQSTTKQQHIYWMYQKQSPLITFDIEIPTITRPFWGSETPQQSLNPTMQLNRVLQIPVHWSKYRFSFLSLEGHDPLRHKSRNREKQQHCRERNLSLLALIFSSQTGKS